MNNIANRMYSLCIARCEAYERGVLKVGNRHHLAQRLAKYAQIAALSDQQYRIFMLLKDKHLTAAQAGKKMKITSKHASACLGKLLAYGLVQRHGKVYSHDSFLTQ